MLETPRLPGPRIAWLSILLLALMALPGVYAARADERVWHHAMSLVDAPEYPADFTHFKWANPDAPKGGSVRLSAIGSFDTLNPYPVAANVPAGIGLVTDTLMVSSPDEASVEYGLIAEAVSYPDDYSSVTFRLRKEARFSDGSPVTPEDVIFSFEMQKEINPQIAYYYQNVVKAEKTADNEVTFTFDVKGNRELPHIMGQLDVLSKAYWTAEGRDLSRSTLTPFVGSGGYRVKSLDAGRAIVYERIKDYWAKDLPVMKGLWNLDEIRYDYFRDPSIAFEAFKAGDIDEYTEASSKNWATAYDFPALQKGLVVKRTVELETPEGMQAFVLNLRHQKFADARVREAFNLVFDFEWANANLFYGQYTRTSSFFQNSDLASSGLPEGRELEILQGLKDEVPPEVFTTPYANPVNATPADFRKNLREAARLMKAAGFSVKGGVLVDDKTGQPFAVEFLLPSGSSFERIVLPYIQNLNRLGIKASVREVDDSQYEKRVNDFDYDIIVFTFSQSESPGNEQRYFWGSAAADRKGSRNFIGIKNPAVDKLIDMIIFAKDRDELVAATRALDRVLLWNHYVVPQWYFAGDRIAYWDKYRRVEPGPRRASAFPMVWWQDEAAAKRIASGKAPE
ncbi:MAG: extracellular solute-binding protein [Hyphomicrobiaceae bacterium]